VKKFYVCASVGILLNKLCKKHSDPGLQSVSVTQSRPLNLRVIIAAYFSKSTECKNIACGKTEEFLVLKQEIRTIMTVL